MTDSMMDAAGTEGFTHYNGGGKLLGSCFQKRYVAQSIRQVFPIRSFRQRLADGVLSGTQRNTAGG